MIGSWFSHITRPLNGLGFMKGIAELHIRKKLLLDRFLSVVLSWDLVFSI